MGAVFSLSRIQLLTGGGPEALRFSRTQLLSLQTSLSAAHILTAREGKRGPKMKANLLHPNPEADFCHIHLLRKKLASSAHIQWKELHKEWRQGSKDCWGTSSRLAATSRFSAHSLIFYNHNFALFRWTHLLLVPISHHFIDSFILKLVIWVLYFRICALWVVFCPLPHNKRLIGLTILGFLPILRCLSVALT